MLPALYLRFGGREPTLSPEEELMQRWADVAPSGGAGRACARRVSAMGRVLSARLAVALGAIVLAGCSEVESESATGYEPSSLANERVEFTAEAAERTGLRTEIVRRSGGRVAVPYAALLYDPEGKTYVYDEPPGVAVCAAGGPRRSDRGRSSARLARSRPWHPRRDDRRRGGLRD